MIGVIVLLVLIVVGVLYWLHALQFVPEGRTPYVLRRERLVRSAGFSR